MSTERGADICIIGLGPAGLGAAVTLARPQSALNVLCIEAGPLPEGRFCSILAGETCRKEEPCHMISGVGGCCTLGGSKISGFPAGRGLAKVLGSEERAQRSLGAALNRFEAFVPLRHNVKGQESVEEARRIFNKMGFAYRYYDSSSFERGKFCLLYTSPSPRD